MSSDNVLVDPVMPGSDLAQQGSQARRAPGAAASANPAAGANLDEDDDDDDDRKPGRERRKIEIKFIQDKSRRHITFSKRKAGIMKKAYELSVLTGTQVLLLVVSETGLVYTFTTPKLQPLVTKPEGKNLIQACLNAPEDGQNGEPGQQPVQQQPPLQQQAPQQLSDPNSLGGLAPHAGQGLVDEHGAHLGPRGVPGQAGIPNNVYISPEQAAAYNQYLNAMPQQQQQQQQRYLPPHPHLQSRPQ